MLELAIISPAFLHCFIFSYIGCFIQCFLDSYNPQFRSIPGIFSLVYFIGITGFLFNFRCSGLLCLVCLCLIFRFSCWPCRFILNSCRFRNKFAFPPVASKIVKIDIKIINSAVAVVVIVGIYKGIDIF